MCLCFSLIWARLRAQDPPPLTKRDTLGYFVTEKVWVFHQSNSPLDILLTRRSGFSPKQLTLGHFATEKVWIFHQSNSPLDVSLPRRSRFFTKATHRPPSPIRLTLYKPAPILSTFIWPNLVTVCPCFSSC